MKRVVVGLSGGVDSSVAAWLLKEQGYDVVGLFMRNWHDTTGTLSGDCPWEDDQLFAELVARRLDIPFHWVDLSEQYRERVVDYMFAEYERGRTPNPDVLCNREIKFDVFLQEALRLGADYVATGHYCRGGNTSDGSGCTPESPDENGYYRLLAGIDGNKDQSYFLCQLSQGQLSRAMFPIGGMLKSEVRRIAEEQKLATAKRKDSQGICFVGKVDLPTFLQQKLAAKKGDIIEIPAEWGGYSAQRCQNPNQSQNPNPNPNPNLSSHLHGQERGAPYVYSPTDGEKVGEHDGAHFYTIGQRKGLGVGGKAEPLFVIATDVVRNVVYAGQGEAHPGLYRQELYISEDELHWVRPDREVLPGESERFSFRIRYRQPLQGGVLIRLAADESESKSKNGNGGRKDAAKDRIEAAGSKGAGARIVFDKPQRGVTPGQFAAFYDGEELIGSGVID